MPIQASQQLTVSVRLGPVTGSPSDDFVFNLNPSAIRYEHDSVYVPVPVPLADWGPNTPSGNPPPVQWARNNPSRISMEFWLVDEKSLNGSGRDDIEAEITKLENFRYKSARFNGEPPDLVLSVGPQHDRVRLDKLLIDPRVWTPGLYRQKAYVTMQLIVIRPRSR